MMRRIADAVAFNRMLDSLAVKIDEQCPKGGGTAIVGIQRRGVHLAERLAVRLESLRGVPLLRGDLDITFYRDDLSMVAQQPVVHGSHLPFALDDKTIVLVDDVIYTGRTARAALDALTDYGRPRAVRLCALVDRGWRELPIQPDFTGIVVPTRAKDVVHVRVRELDGEDAIDIAEGEEEV
ncbi:MAG: bifunctional pyr operon transcriptional regulator/uracil phosphoribosyltransferase PyrR [bacterium]|nr:bifunctional pyr operon transcriptional regulator/uracil phosphoribosyltransferase PyrR [bacterium]